MAQWSIPIHELARKAGVDVQTAARKVTFDLFRNIIITSPVDTGRFRANWNVSYGNTDNTVDNSTNPTRALAALEKIKVGPIGVWYLCNALPYAQVLEDGSSGQAPNGMVRITVRAFEEFVRRAVRS